MAARGQENPYTVLGVAPTASDAQIRAAFRRLVRALHPDTTAGEPVAGDQLDRVVAAYETLRDPQRRTAYDDSRRAQPASPAPPRRTVRVDRRATDRTADRPADRAADRPRIVVVLGLRPYRAAPEAPLRAGPVRVERWRR
ncbi:J domain-containing protein [Streptomyces ficellus]|uniref:J domain-containing protein n=1 Tax=Streptomyces ficellus TaxID=1977088 RepID=A0ABT7Z5F4_9ACTN|nr:J domain-containing protein [Streptomyces ficellus]MDN3294326.1 J domain-containing protein [Streptomyces ficellus]